MKRRERVRYESPKYRCVKALKVFVGLVFVAVCAGVACFSFTGNTSVLVGFIATFLAVMLSLFVVETSRL